MTKKEFFEAVANGTTNEEIMGKAKEILEKMAEDNEKRKNKSSKKSIENEPVKKAIIEILKDGEKKTATMIAEKYNEENDEEISIQKTSTLCRQLYEIGDIDREDIRVKGRSAKVYFISGTNENE